MNLYIKSSILYLRNNFYCKLFKINIISNRNCQKERALSGLIELAINLKVGLKWLPWGSNCHNLIQILSDNISAPLLGTKGKSSLGKQYKV